MKWEKEDKEDKDGVKCIMKKQSHFSVGLYESILLSGISSRLNITSF